MPPIEKQQLTRAMGVTLTIAALGAAICTTAAFVDLPLVLLLTAALCWLAGLVAFGVLTYRAVGMGVVSARAVPTAGEWRQKPVVGTELDPPQVETTAAPSFSGV